MSQIVELLALFHRFLNLSSIFFFNISSLCASDWIIAIGLSSTSLIFLLSFKFYCVIISVSESSHFCHLLSVLSVVEMFLVCMLSNYGMYSGYLKCFVMRHLALVKFYVECWFFITQKMTHLSSRHKFQTIYCGHASNYQLALQNLCSTIDL